MIGISVRRFGRILINAATDFQSATFLFGAGGIDKFFFDQFDWYLKLE